MATTRPSGTLGIVLAGVAVTVLLGVPAARPARHPNVILITVDTLRADRLSAYGYRKSSTPGIDRLAREGVLFESAFCDVTWTTASMASVMTGHYATTHGVRSSYQRLAPGATTLAEILRGAGYHTAAVVGSFPLAAMFGLDRGFELYDDDFTARLMSPRDAAAAASVPDPGPGSRAEMRAYLRYKAAHDAYRPDAEVSDRAIHWLRAERRDPFFLWVHYFGPHERVHEGSSYLQDAALEIKDYDEDVARTDAQVGRLLAALDELGLTGSTDVILHADHGQSLAEHGFVGHGRYVYDVLQHVPLLMRLPGRAPVGRRAAQMVRNIDVLPTVLALTGVRPPLSLAGASVLPLIDDDRARGASETYVETYQSANWKFADVIDQAHDVRLGFRRLGIRTPEWKFIVNDPTPFPSRARTRRRRSETRCIGATTRKSSTTSVPIPESSRT